MYIMFHRPGARAKRLRQSVFPRAPSRRSQERFLCSRVCNHMVLSLAIHFKSMGQFLIDPSSPLEQ